MKFKYLYLIIYLLSTIVWSQNYKYRIYNLTEQNLNFIVFNTEDHEIVTSDSSLGIELMRIWTVPIIDSKNYPNPFSPSQTFQFVVEDFDTVKLELLNKNRELLSVIFNEKFLPGSYRMELLKNSINTEYFILKYYKNDKNWEYLLGIN
ncbi:MAG: hypothetical protein IPM32_10855 [Ignavibacteriae bacterium]|nr:hypothetical protein [Ignavibacteriota bacterium]